MQNERGVKRELLEAAPTCTPFTRSVLTSSIIWLSIFSHLYRHPSSGLFTTLKAGIREAMSGICVENIADIVLWLQGQKAMLCIGYPGRFIGAFLYLIFASAVQEPRTLPVIE